MTTLRISLFGHFKVVANATDVTPRSEKARALIALLATGHGGERRRAWLQDKLWSHATTERGGHSLRQALSDVRKAFGDNGGHLEADRRRVRLTQYIVEEAEPGAQFLETLEIADPEFNDWVRVERAAHEPKTTHFVTSILAASQDWIVQIGGAKNADPAIEFMRTSLVERICYSVNEQVPIRICDGSGERPNIILDIDCLSTAQSTTYRVAWRKGGSGFRLWSAVRMVGTDGGPQAHNVDLLKLANDAVKGLFEVRRQELLRSREESAPDMMMREAIAQVFSMRPKQFDKADALFQEAHLRDPRGVFDAWRAMLRMIRVIERHDVDVETTRDEAIAMIRYALERDALNSTVQSIAANIFLMFMDADDVAMDMAREAVSQNATNPLAWDALGLVAIHYGDREKSHQHALRAQRIGGSGMIKHWLDMACCLTSVMTHDLELANAFAKSSHVLAPEFRPPVRYQLAIAAERGAWSDAERARDALMELEPDFSVERMMSDETYPMAAYRASGLSLSRLKYLA